MNRKKYDFTGSREDSSNISPWQRNHPPTPFAGIVTRNSDPERFDDYTYDNMYLDINVKRAVLKVSASVVSITLSRGVSINALDKIDRIKFVHVLREGNSIADEFAKSGIDHGFVLRNLSGTIIRSEEHVDGTYYLGTILTSASLVADLDSLENTTIDIYLHDGTKYNGEISLYDFHYNVATVQTRTVAMLTPATIVHVDDCMPLNESDDETWKLRRHSKVFTLSPGDVVVSLGRYIDKTCDLMAAPGVISVDSCHLDCKELFRANCKITKCGIGGPLINKNGEVLGVNFFDGICTPFLPMNLVSKILKHHKKYGTICRPWLGLEMTNLYTANIEKLEKILQKFPNTSVGVLVEEVVEGSPADKAGIHCDDVIVQCGKEVVRSVLELNEKMYAKSGRAVNIVLLREISGEQLKVTMIVEETNPDKFNRWPLPQECLMSAKGIW